MSQLIPQSSHLQADAKHCPAWLTKQASPLSKDQNNLHSPCLLQSSHYNYNQQEKTELAGEGGYCSSSSLTQHHMTNHSYRWTQMLTLTSWKITCLKPMPSWLRWRKAKLESNAIRLQGKFPGSCVQHYHPPEPPPPLCSTELWQLCLLYPNCPILLAFSFLSSIRWKEFPSCLSVCFFSCSSTQPAKHRAQSLMSIN